MRDHGVERADTALSHVPSSKIYNCKSAGNFWLATEQWSKPSNCPLADFGLLLASGEDEP